ncbi:MAG: MAPEG family protein [Rhizobiales bacterium]|nr:MAPEG family protein [Hyphomicrobiales bacterium]
MSVQMVLAPVFALVFLIFAVMLGMFRVRTKAVMTKEVRVSQIALGQDAWPKKATQISNTYMNLFEMPVLFFALIAFALPLRQADLVIVLLSWVYVALRYLHAGVYATSNDMRYRFGFFAASAMVLLAMWVYFALKLFLAI